MKSKLFMVMAAIAVMGLTEQAEAALWNLNFGTKTYAGAGEAPQSTSDDVWQKAGTTTAGGDFFSTDATGSEYAVLATSSASVTSTNTMVKLQGYSQGLSQLDMNFGDSSTYKNFEVYLYTTGGQVTLLPGTGMTMGGSTVVNTGYADGSGTLYRVTRYSVFSSDEGILKLATSSTDGTGKINAVQVRSVVPEPSTIMLLGVGGLIASFGVKRRYATIES